jgi:hypothetical protein
MPCREITVWRAYNALLIVRLILKFAVETLPPHQLAELLLLENDVCVKDFPFAPDDKVSLIVAMRLCLIDIEVRASELAHDRVHTLSRCWPRCAGPSGNHVV